MIHREVLKNYPKELINDSVFLKYCFGVLVDNVVTKSKCNRNDVNLILVNQHDNMFSLDKVMLVAEVEIKA